MRGSCRGVIEIESDAAEALLASLDPDNKTAPPGINVRCEASGNQLSCIVEVEDCTGPRGIGTFRNTVDDILRSVKAALEALKAALQ